MSTLKLQRVGRNYYGNIAYKDENGRFYLDIDMVEGKIPEDIKPEWCTAEEISELERKAMAVK